MILPAARATRAHHPKPSIEDVAAAAGVSTATVSRAIRGLPRVAQPTRTRILEIAQALATLRQPPRQGSPLAGHEALALSLPPFATPTTARLLKVPRGHSAGGITPLFCCISRIPLPVDGSLWT